MYTLKAFISFRWIKLFTDLSVLIGIPQFRQFQRTLSQNKSKTKFVDSMVEILSGPAHQGLSIEPSTNSLTALLETTDHFKTLDFWVRNLDLVGALRLNINILPMHIYKR